MPEVTPREVSRVAHLSTHGIVWLDASGPWSEATVWGAAEAGVVLAPSEKLRLMAVDLPLSSARQRRAALPFAIEEFLAEPLFEVHVALGPEIAHRRYLAGAVHHELMANWVEAVKAAELSHCRIVPDVLAVPRPPEGAWSVWIVATRALIRRADGAGFALDAASLPVAWKIAGEPPLVHHGGELPAELVASEIEKEPVVDIDAARFDLRQGIYAHTEQGWRRPSKVAALLVSLGLVGHVGAAVIDTLALRQLADERRSEARAMLREVAPELPANVDTATLFQRFLPAGSQPQDLFLPLFARVSEALQPFSEGLAVQALAFSATDNTLNLDLQASDLAALQRIEVALNDAGLQVTSGVATTGGGSAEARMVIQSLGGL